ncbi:probable transmembrane ascorbate ferrireductase 3 [Amaranthus tricolor]|uniref:probable transmembrane ascorbate ferrireductase 3 n=1 Tax=Amaranthus tricolor TaxID=29722 RepID=UPI002584BFB9|nr:probable transmembrane ascorbate ferrireductase 3 [Amaranthus tricolor]
MDFDRDWYREKASRIAVLAHIFGIIALILMLVWLLHYRGGFNLDDYENPTRIFNIHPFLMFFGFIFFAGEAMMVYKTVIAEPRTQKMIHMIMHIIAITLGIVGIYATFKYHSAKNLTTMYTMHSWIGLGTFILYGIQWLVGFVTYWIPRRSSTRARFAPWHVNLGRILLYMAICTAETGLMQIFTILRLVASHEARLINFIGLAILLFGITVDLSISFARFGHIN